MSNGEITEDLKRFIHSSINSVEQLEVLLLLAENVGIAWTPADAAAKLYIQPESAEARLKDLCSKGLCICDDPAGSHYKYGCVDTNYDQYVAELRFAYKARRVTIIKLIFSSPIYSD